MAKKRQALIRKSAKRRKRQPSSPINVGNPGQPAKGVAGTFAHEPPPLGAAATGFPRGQPDPSHWQNNLFDVAAQQIVERRAAVLATTGPSQPPFPPADGGTPISGPQEQPEPPAPVMHKVVANLSTGIETQVEARRDVSVPLGASTTAMASGRAELTLTPTPVTIVPTLYPREPGTPLAVNGFPQIDRRSPELRQLNTKLDQIIELLAQSNQITGDTRDQLVAEIQAGKALLIAPKPNTDLLNVLLIHPLVWIASVAAGAVVGERAIEALHLVEGIFHMPIPI